MKKIIGHNEIIERLKKRDKNNSFSHANLIIGEDGIGKSVIAKYLASHILKGIDDFSSVDIVNYYPSSSSFGVDEVRKIIIEINKKPYEGNKKVIILYKCDKMTAQAQNALLKTIEEPPEGVFLILLSDSLENILDTIQSRCQVYKLTPLTQKEMMEYINENHDQISEKDMMASLAYSMGVPGKADKFFNDENLRNIRSSVTKLFDDMLNREKQFVVKYEKILEKFKDEKYDLLDMLLLYIRDIMVFKELNQKDKVINYDEFDYIEKVSRRISYKKLNSMLEYIKEARMNFNSNSNYSMTIGILLMGFAEV